MKPRLLTNGAWLRLTKLAKSQRGACAVPYFGTNGSKLLPLRPGSTLVVKFDRAAMQAGQTNPHEIIRLIQNDVNVYACRNLHAKVFTFGDTSIVGSTNVSGVSATKLMEACVEVGDAAFAGKCRSFINSMRGEPVDLEYAEGLKKFYVPPKDIDPELKKSKRTIPQHSRLWLVALATRPWTDRDCAEETSGWGKAQENLDEAENYKIETFQWSGGKFVEALRMHERLLMSTKIDNGTVRISPPGRIVNIKRYAVKGKRRAIVYVAVPSGKRSRRQESFLASLGAYKGALGNIRRSKLIRDSAAVSRIGAIFR